MAWGDQNVSKLQFLQNNTVAWGPGGTPIQTQILQAGILRRLRLLTQGTPVFTAGGGAINADPLGPFNVYTNVQLLSNQQQPVFNLSGYGLALVNDLINGLEMMGNTPDTELVAVASQTDTSYIFNGRQVAAGSAPANTNWGFSLRAPVAQRVSSLGGDIGMIPLSTANVQLTLGFTPGSATSASPYKINTDGANPTGTQPYNVVGGTADSVTLASPTMDIMREMYEAVESPNDFPNYRWISQWIEEFPQTYGTGGFVWRQQQNAGILARLMFFVWDSTNSQGVRTTNLTGSNALQLQYDAQINKFVETGQEALFRQKEQLGRSMPQGTFFYDLLGPNLTWADVLDSYEVPNITASMNFSTAIGAISTLPPKVIRQTFMPIVFH